MAGANKRSDYVRIHERLDMLDTLLVFLVRHMWPPVRRVIDYAPLFFTTVLAISGLSLLGFMMTAVVSTGREGYITGYMANFMLPFADVMPWIAYPLYGFILVIIALILGKLL